LSAATNKEKNMSSGGIEVGVIGKLLEWAWAAVGILVGIIWKRHNEEIIEIKASIQKVGESMDGRLSEIEHSYVLKEVYEQNRKEVRDVQIKTFDRLDAIGQSLARIEGKLDK
jgi:hypothetical protein